MQEKDKKLVSTELTGMKYLYDAAKIIAEKNSKVVTFEQSVMDSENTSKNLVMLFSKFKKPVLCVNILMSTIINTLPVFSKISDEGDNDRTFSIKIKELSDITFEVFMNPFLPGAGTDFVIFDADDIEHTATIVNYNINELM